MATLSDKTAIKTTLGGALAAIGLVASFHPWALAQVREVVREEAKVTELQRRLEITQPFEALRGDIKELRAEIRGLRIVIERNGR